MVAFEFLQWIFGKHQSIINKLMAREQSIDSDLAETEENWKNVHMMIESLMKIAKNIDRGNYGVTEKEKEELYSQYERLLSQIKTRMQVLQAENIRLKGSFKNQLNTVEEFEFFVAKRLRSRAA